MYRNARFSFSTIQQWRVFPRKASEKKSPSIVVGTRGGGSIWQKGVKFMFAYTREASLHIRLKFFGRTYRSADF
jgi:hypothetical protein